MENWPRTVYRVNIDYLSREYDDRMLSTSSPYRARQDAENAYTDAITNFCVDDPARPARVSLTSTTFPGPYEWGITETIKQNY